MLTGVILAGGPNDILYGRPKSFLSISGQKIIDRQFFEMRKICKEIIVVTNTPRSYLSVVPSDVRIITDFYQNKGPLGGIHAGLSLASQAYVWIVASSMPFINSSAINFMLRAKKQSNFDAIVPKIEGSDVPFHGIYNKHTLPVIKSLFGQEQHSLDQYLQTINCIRIPESHFKASHIDITFPFTIVNKEDYLKLRSQPVKHTPL
jgi:molybdenum cofactor guanylyltransferase